MNERTRPKLVLAGCFLISIGMQAFIIAPSSVAPLLVDRFDTSQAAIGEVVSVVLLGTIIVQFPSGYLLDSFDNRRVVVPAVGAYVAVVLGVQVVDTFGQFLVLRAFAGLAIGLVFTAGANMVAQVFDDDERGFATGVYLASPPVGWAIAHLTSPLVATAFGPLRIFLLHGLLAVTGTLLFVFAAGEPISSDGRPRVAELARAFGNRSIVLVSISAFAAYALYLYLNTWLPTYGSDVLSLPLVAAGAATAIVPLAGIVARPTGGWLSGYFGGRHRLVLVGGLSLGLAFLVTTPFTTTVVPFLLAVAGAAFALQLGTGVYYVATRELATPGTEGTSLTVLTSISFTGSFVAPIAGGWLITAYSWTVAFVVFAAVGVVGILVLIPLARS